MPPEQKVRFIIAGLGQSLKVTSDFLYPVVVGISTVTAFTTPLTVRAGPVARSIEDAAMVQFLSLLVAIVLAAPFIWGLLFSRPQWERVRRQG